VDGFGHVSMRHPSAPNRYLLARSIAPALVIPGDIIEYDLDSNPCNANGRGSFLERFIHGEIYKARPDIMSVVHSHSPSVVPFGLVGVPMQAMFHNAAFIAAGVPVFDIRDRFGATDMLVGNGAKGVALAEAMGDKDHRAHARTRSRGVRADAAGGGIPRGLYRGQCPHPALDDSAWRRRADGGARRGRRPARGRGQPGRRQARLGSLAHASAKPGQLVGADLKDEG
jgi:hypothetical protein